MVVRHQKVIVLQELSGADLRGVASAKATVTVISDDFLILFNQELKRRGNSPFLSFL